MPWNESGGEPPGGGEPGAPGADGRTWLSGAGAPDSGAGEDGDFYLDTSASAYYGPKTAGSWGSATSLVGPPGEDGDEGPAGPAPSGGSDGQFVKRVGGAPAWATIAIADINALQAALDAKMALNSAIAETGYSDSQRQMAATGSNQWRINATTGGGIYLLVQGAYGLLVQAGGSISSPGQWSISNTGAVLPSTVYMSSGVIDYSGGMRIWSSSMATRSRMYSGSSEANAGVIASNGNLANRAGAVEVLALAVSLGNGLTREVATTAASRNLIVEVWDTTDKWTEYRVKNGVVSVLRQDADATHYVANAPGAGQIGLEVSGSTLRLNNNSGAAVTIGYAPRGI